MTIFSVVDSDGRFRGRDGDSPAGLPPSHADLANGDAAARQRANAGP